MRPKRVYIIIRQWLVDTEMDNYFSGRVMEYTWHILFGDPPVTQALDVGVVCGDYRYSIEQDDT